MRLLFGNEAPIGAPSSVSRFVGSTFDGAIGTSPKVEVEKKGVPISSRAIGDPCGPSDSLSWSLRIRKGPIILVDSDRGVIIADDW